MKKVIFCAATIASLMALVGCNTIQGVGKDLEKGGEAIQKAVKS